MGPTRGGTGIRLAPRQSVLWTALIVLLVGVNFPHLRLASAAFSKTTSNSSDSLTAHTNFTYAGVVGLASPNLYYQTNDVQSSAATSNMADTSGSTRTGTYNGRTDGPSPWWKFDEGSGSTAADASGSAAPGTLTGAGAGWNATGKYNSAFAVSGTGYVLGQSRVHTDTDWTVMAWVYATADNATQAAVAQVGSRSSAFMLKRDGPLDKFLVVTTRTDVDAPTVDQVVGTSSATLNTWFHVAATYVDSTNTVTLYVNGTSEGSLNTKSLDWDATTNVVAGSSKWAGAITDQWTGRVDDVRVYGRALSGAEITTAKAGGSTISPMTSELDGALAGSDQVTGTAVAFAGAVGAYYGGATYNNPVTFTMECNVRVTGTAGGDLMGLSATTTGAADANHDRVLYVDSGGKVSFAVNNGAIKTVRSTSTINDGTWHHVAASMGAAGLKIYVDGALEGSDATTTTAANFAGYVRVAGMSLSGFTNQPTSDYLIGSLDEVAYYSTQLTDAQIYVHNVATN